jgi:hypothetical protein
MKVQAADTTQYTAAGNDTRPAAARVLRLLVGPVPSSQRSAGTKDAGRAAARTRLSAAFRRRKTAQSL